MHGEYVAEQQVGIKGNPGALNGIFQLKTSNSRIESTLRMINDPDI